VTSADSGDTGRIEGKMGMGAPLEGTPFVHVARLVAAGRCLVAALWLAEVAAGDGAGDRGCIVEC
jgi:hypothetical protein